MTRLSRVDASRPQTMVVEPRCYNPATRVSIPSEDRRPVGAFHRPELDVLRFAAFALVFCSHDLPSMAGVSAAGFGWAAWLAHGVRESGAYGVDLFFLLSAYLITEILLREHVRTGTIDVPAFLLRRALRIWPLYFAFLALAYWVVPLIYPQWFPPRVALAFLFFTGNFAWMGADPRTVAGILWSVSIEEQFYLVWPLVLRTFRHRLTAVCVLLIVVSNAARLYFVLSGSPHLEWLWFNTVTRLDPIAIGALLAIHLRGAQPVLPAWARGGLFAGGLLLLVLSGLFFPADRPTLLLAYPAAALASLAMFVATLGVPWPMPRVLVYLGRVSYGLYVFHMLAITITRAHIHLTPTALEWAVQFSSAFLLTIGLASLSYFTLEAPFLRLKARQSRLGHAGDVRTQPSA